MIAFVSIAVRWPSSHPTESDSGHVLVVTTGHTTTYVEISEKAALALRASGVSPVTLEDRDNYLSAL